jgi:acetylornithine/N-succinyldiaminopimelate aminotransferase
MAQARRLATKHPEIVDVRGAGLMIGIELHSAELAKAVLAEMLAQRIILNRTSETVLRFLPPYILERQHVDTALAALDGILSTRTAPQLETAQPATAGAAAHG